MFADADYWIALTNPADQWYGHAVIAGRAVAARVVVTSEPALCEMLAAFSGGGAHLRRIAVGVIRGLPDDPQVEIVEQSHALFEAGLELYARRPDKSYSLVDCMSMVIARERGITEVLTHDHHFEQEGFIPLLRSAGR